MNIKEMLEKYETLYKMAIVSRNGCALPEDVIYEQFIFGKITILEDIIYDLKHIQEERK